MRRARFSAWWPEALRGAGVFLLFVFALVLLPGLVRAAQHTVSIPDASALTVRMFSGDYGDKRYDAMWFVTLSGVVPGAPVVYFKSDNAKGFSQGLQLAVSASRPVTVVYDDTRNFPADSSIKEVIFLDVLAVTSAFNGALAGAFFAAAFVLVCGGYIISYAVGELLRFMDKGLK